MPTFDATPPIRPVLCFPAGCGMVAALVARRRQRAYPSKLFPTLFRGIAAITGGMYYLACAFRAWKTDSQPLLL